jgi:hypothetical protein
MEGMKLKKREIKTADKQLECNICFPFTYHKTDTSLRKHRSTHHREYIKNQKDITQTLMMECNYCKKTYSTPFNCKVHMQSCLGKQEFIEELLRLSDEPISMDEDAPVIELQDDYVEPFSISDGQNDLLAWELREVEEDNNRRDPVALEADVLKFSWKELARIQ